MGFKNIDVEVSGAQGGITATYKTVVMKGNVPFSEQIERNGGVKYVVKWDFVLDGDVTMPENCILEFDGGSISNADGNGYKITGNDTVLLYYVDRSKVIKVTLDGTWKELAAVAHSGSYNDLKDKPVIPTIPTNVSAFVNDAYYITGATLVSELPENPYNGQMVLYQQENVTIPAWWDGEKWIDAMGTEIVVESEEEEEVGQ